MSSRTGRENRPRDAQQWLALVYAIATLAPAALMLLHILLSLALAGGQALPDTRRLWGEVVRYPVLVIPGPLLLVLAGIALVLVVPLVVTTSARRSGALPGLLRFTFAMLIADAFFAFAFPSPDGLLPRPDADDALGVSWIGVPVAVVCSIVLLVRILQTNSEHARLMRSGELDDQ